ncbi:hypothetical protein ACFQ4X_07095 [Fictibacillus halophilus]|uniref:hypothetical protein n=1 Tax=Fictibacillus halophilus TaxID=1610490 RepID=UPI00362871B7
MNATFEIDFNNVNEVKELKELLERRLLQLQNETSITEVPSKSIQEVDSETLLIQDNIEILKRFATQASKNQLEVLKWMKAHPGKVSAHILKKELPFLAPHGALSGVFRPGRWQRLSGGTKDGFPFFQIEWNHEKGCGIYRGLTQEEGNALTF